MNDWYNANEHRCYPFKETTSNTLDKKEIVDCRFFLKNATNTTIYLASKEETINEETNEPEWIYTFHTQAGNIKLAVPKTSEYKVIKFNDKTIGYGFVVFGDTTVQDTSA